MEGAKAKDVCALSLLKIAVKLGRAVPGIVTLVAHELRALNTCGGSAVDLRALTHAVQSIYASMKSQSQSLKPGVKHDSLSAETVLDRAEVNRLLQLLVSSPIPFS